MLNLNENGTRTSLLYIKKLFFNLKRNLKLETFDHELLLITLHLFQNLYGVIPLLLWQFSKSF